MEKPAVAKPKFRLSMFLTKAAAAINLQNQPFSPGKVNAIKFKSQQNKGFSGPISSIVFEEARRNESKNSSFNAAEPSSPKISCMGQIKHRTKQKKKKKKNMSKNKNSTSQIKELVDPNSSFPKYPRNKPSSVNKEGKKKKLNSRSILINREEPRRKSDASAERSGGHKLPDRAPRLSQMKRFSSGRDTLSKFDWTTAQIAPEDPADNPRYFSDEEKRDYEEEEEEERIPFSAPLILGDVGSAAFLPLEPRKEINLWKRRTMAQPKPLQLNTW